MCCGGNSGLARTFRVLSSEAPLRAEGARIRGNQQMSSERQEQKLREMTSLHSTRGTKLLTSSL